MPTQLDFFPCISHLECEPDRNGSDNFLVKCYRDHHILKDCVNKASAFGFVVPKQALASTNEDSSFPSVTSTPSPARRGASVPAKAVTKKAGSVKNPAVKKAPAKKAAKGKAAAKAVTKKAHARRVK